jgi:hypothetical protein
MIILTSSRELTNIPITYSVLYEQEYKNKYLLKMNIKKRRAFSETNIQQINNILKHTIKIK